jgi:hypothetical protein
VINLGTDTYDDSWIYLEIAERCVALRQDQRLTRDELVFRFMAQFPSVPDRDTVLAWIAGLFRAGEVTGEAVDEWSLVFEKFNTLVHGIAPEHTASPAHWIRDQFETYFPGRGPFDLPWDELDEFITDAARKAITEGD